MPEVLILVPCTLVLLRLLQAKGALNSAADYNLFATAAADQSNFNEAQAVIDHGIAAKVVDPASPLFKDTIAALKTKPKATETDLTAAAKTATSGMALVRIGDRFYAIGQYAKAVEVYRQALPHARRVVATEIAQAFEGDAFAPTLGPEWVETAREARTATNGLPFAFVIFERKD